MESFLNYPVPSLSAFAHRESRPSLFSVHLDYGRNWVSKQVGFLKWLLLLYRYMRIAVAIPVPWFQHRAPASKIRPATPPHLRTQDLFTSTPPIAILSKAIVAALYLTARLCYHDKGRLSGRILFKIKRSGVLFWFVCFFSQPQGSMQRNAK